MALIPAGQASSQISDVLRSREPWRSERGAALPQSAGSLGVPENQTYDQDWLDAPIESVLRRRCSVREFAPEPVSADDIATIVSSAYLAERQTWPAPAHGPMKFVIAIAALRVNGMAEGLYAATYQGTGVTMKAAQGMGIGSLRDDYADAAALLLVCGDLRAACRDAGGSGYGTMLVRAGTLGYAAWLSAVSVGLAGSVYGGASHDVSAWARHLGTGLRHMFTLAAGVPAGNRNAGQAGD